MSEMVVPYLCPRWPHYRKNAFDAGDYGMGNLANSLVLGCDCLGEIHYFDVYMSNCDGRVRRLKNAICMHEEDDGLLWKHTDWRLRVAGDPMAVQSARATKLIISFWCVVGNYDYSVRYVFHQDGKFEPMVQATGLINPAAILPHTVSEFGQTLGGGLEAQHHQHAFSFRFDMNIDGSRNTVKEVDSMPMAPHPDTNKWGNALQVQVTPLTSPTMAQRDINTQLGRLWLVTNEQVLNRVGEPVAWALVPGHNSGTMLSAVSPALRRAPFMKHHVFVTAFDPDQLYACGDYPNQSNPEKPHAKNKLVGGDYPTDDRVSLLQQDIVVWHTVILHHLVCLEDFPIMPTATIGFRWQPVGFFNYNPTIHITRQRGMGAALPAKL